MSLANLFANLPTHADEELLEILAQGHGARVERIVSTGQASPPGFWYDQDQDEWVVVLSGEARLLFANEADSVVMRPGDHVLIEAHRKHRVEWTSPHEPTVWLAVFLPTTSQNDAWARNRE